MRIVKNTPETRALTAAVRKALGACKSDADIRRSGAMVQLLAVAKGILDPADVRIGGTLTPQQSAAFYSAMVDDGSLSQVSTERMTRLTKGLDAMEIATRQLKRVAQGDLPAAGDLTESTNPGNTLTAKNAQLFARIALDTLRDNADNPNFVATFRAKLNTRWQNDLCDLAMNGTGDDYAGSAFLKLNKGWLTLASEKTGVIDVTVSPGGLNYATLTTGAVADNNGLTWTAVQGGVPGNDVRVVLKDPAGNSQALAVTVAGTVITASLATGVAGAITTTGVLLKAAIEANANAAALVSVAHTGASTGAGVVTVANKVLTGGGIEGWIDAFAAIRAASPALNRDQCAFFASPDNCDAYNVELGKHVTGSAVITNSNGAGFLAQRVIPWPTMPSNRILFTPPENLVVGIHDRVERSSEYDGEMRALKITTDAAFDFEFRSDALVTLAVVQ